MLQKLAIIKQGEKKNLKENGKWLQIRHETYCMARITGNSIN
jgi:hypothetical protein